VGSFVAAYGHFFMAADNQSRFFRKRAGAIARRLAKD